jgi:hypothetical protein
MVIETVMTSVLAALIYSGSAFFKKSVDPDKPQSFKPIKLVSTLVVGAFIGLVSGQMGIIPSSGGIELQLMTYSGLIMVVENTMKTVKRTVQTKL